MEFADALPRLVALCDQGRLVPFTGLGMSSPTCTSWYALVRSLADTAQKRKLGSFAQLTAKTPADQLPQWAHRVVALLRRALPRADFVAAMRKALYAERFNRADPGSYLTPSTQALARVRWPLLLTTNYDDLFYRAVRAADAARRAGRPARNDLVDVRGRSGYDCERVVAGLTSPTRRTIWALQGFLASADGVLEHESSATDPRAAVEELAGQMVVGHEEYRRVTYREPWFRRAFAEVFRARSFLFLGSGLGEHYLLELFGEAVEMTGMSPYPHYAFVAEQKVRKGVIDPDFFLSRLNIIVVPYRADRRHTQLTRRLGAFADAVDAERLKPASVGFSFRVPARLGVRPDAPDVLIVRGELPPPGARECVGVSCGRTGDPPVPVPGGDATRGGQLYLDSQNLGLSPTAFDWLDAGNTLGRFRRSGRATDPTSPYFGLVARSVGSAAPDVKNLTLIPTVCGAFLDAARAARFTVARLMVVAGGPNRPFPALHAAAQMARGIRAWFRGRKNPPLRAVVHVVDPSIWFNIQSGRLNLQELLSCDSFQIHMLVSNPDQSSTRQYRIVGPATTAAAVAASAHVPPDWWAEVYPPPTAGGVRFRLADAPAGKPLVDLGVIPGGTVRFTRG